MKNNNILFLLFLGLFITLNSCQKDYPKDIPKWLKEKIKEREKVCKKEGCFCKSSGIGCWTIFEWDKEGETYFLLDHGRSDVSFDQFISIYDLHGNVLCEDHYST